MNPPNYLEWSKEEKDKYADIKMNAMKIKNSGIIDKYAEVQKDKLAAESRNSSVTNALNREREKRAAETKSSSATNSGNQDQHDKRSPETKSSSATNYREQHDKRTAGHKNSSTNVQKSDAFFERSRAKRVDTDVPVYTREWDRGKESGNYEATLHSPKGFKNYRTSFYEKKNFRNEAQTSFRDDRNYKNDNFPDKKNKYYNKNQHNRSHFDDGHSRQSWNQSSESSRKFKQQKDKKYFSSDTKYHDKYQSNSSSNNSDQDNDQWNEPRRSHTEASALWQSERLNEDKKKQERIFKWVQEQNKRKNRISADVEEKKNGTPKRKLDKIETASDKCSNDNDVIVGSSSRNKPKQNVSLKSPKLQYAGNKSSTEVPQKTQIVRKSFTKFDRINRSIHSSDDSDSDYNLESNKQDHVETDNNNLETVLVKCCEKSENLHSAENEETSNSERKFTDTKSESRSPSYNSGSQFVKRSSDNQRYSVRKVYSHNDGYVISREFNYSDREYYEKDLNKGSKSKRNPNTNPQYDLPESRKNEHFSKQRKFDKGQFNETMNNQRNKWNQKYDVTSGHKSRSIKAEKYKKKSDFNVVQSSNEDEDGWGNIVQSQIGDDDDDNGIWASTDQSDIKWEINEDSDTRKKSPKSNSGANKKEVKAIEVITIGSDDEEWSTVEEKDMKSDDDFEESKEREKEL